LQLALIPVNVRIGDFAGNLKIHRAKVKEAVERGASFLVFPELSLLGYPPRDLLHRPSWAERARDQLEEFHFWLGDKYPETAVLVGTTLPVESGAPLARGLANCAVFLHGKKKAVRAKTLIPFYDIFHESRYFDSASQLPATFRDPIEVMGKKVGILICEDSWSEMSLRGRRLYEDNPSARLVKAGCDFLVNLSASPFDRPKKERRRATIRSMARELGVSIAYVNHFGGQDDLLFDGDAFVFGKEGEILAEKEHASPDILFPGEQKPAGSQPEGGLADLELMAVTGIRDYARKNGFGRAVLGLSGGIDSALVAALACEALGPENVVGIAMPSKYSSFHSVEDAEQLARNLGLVFRHIPIKMPHSTLGMALSPFFEGLPADVTEENLQSRLRGIIVMAFANKLRALGLATGNKSEFAMGYSTLYGDMCGALAPIGDLYKTQVYELARFFNRRGELIPERTFTKAPSAELRPGQTDQDTLPPYDLLDAALLQLVELELEPAAALKAIRPLFPAADLPLLERIHKTVFTTEYKRTQAPPILRLSPRAFGSGRVYPLTCGY
jgi:NAD+ synthase (glutamine-hydrolysing)